jgi:hypothetical protein
MGATSQVRTESRPVVWCSLALVFATATCGGQSSQEPPERRVDLPAFGFIEPEPFLRLPAANDQNGQGFHGVMGVYRFPEGNVVVADASQQLRWFSSAGTVQRRVGVGAEGTDVDRALTWMSGYRGDSLIAYDAASGHLSVFDSEGVLARRFRIETDALPGLTLPHSAFTDGSLLAVRGPSRVQQWSDGWWAVLQLLTHTPEGDPLEYLGTALRHPCRNAVERCAAEFSTYSGIWTAGSSGVYTARPDRSDLRWVTADSAAVLSGPDGWERSAAEGLPTYSRLVVDSESYLWAQSGDLSQVAVFDSAGELRGTVQVPHQLEIYQVGTDFVIGIGRDDRGVEEVQVHRLDRGT